MLKTRERYEEPAICRLGLVMEVNAGKTHEPKGSATDCETSPKNLMPFGAKECVHSQWCKVGDERKGDRGLTGHALS